MAPKKPNISPSQKKKSNISRTKKPKKLLTDEKEYRKVAANKYKKCYKLKKQVWELSALCHVVNYIGPDGKVSDENLDEVKLLLREYWLKKPLERSSNVLKIALEDIKKRTADIDRDWVATEDLRGLWKGLESQLEVVVEKTRGVVKDDDSTTIGEISDISKKIVEKNESLSDHSDT